MILSNDMRNSNQKKKRIKHLTKGVWIILVGLIWIACVQVVHLNKIIHDYQYFFTSTVISSPITYVGITFNSTVNNHQTSSSLNVSLITDFSDKKILKSGVIDDDHSSKPKDLVDAYALLTNTKNEIQLENELPGSPDWILFKPAVNREVEGFMSRTSINKGENISLYYNVNRRLADESSSGKVIIEVFRTGWYDGVGARKVHGPIEVPVIFQIMPTPQAYGLIVCNWSNPYIIQTNYLWTTGVYLVKMTETYSMAQSYAIFVLRNDRKNIDGSAGADIMFQLPFNTYQAYNRWGSRSLYGCYPEWSGEDMKDRPAGSCEGARKVSFDRPYAQPWNLTASFGLGAGEYLSNVQPFANYPIKSAASWNYNMVRWLEKNNLDVTYISNTDVHTRVNKWSKPKLFLTQGHDEYWSWSMRDNTMKWRDDGVHMAFLGSNTAFWQIRYEDISENSTDFEEPRTVVCFRRPKKDPVKDQYRTLKWRNVGRPEALMVGVEYIFPLGDPFDEDLTVFDHSHWIFNGTGVKKGDKIHGLLGYEVDRIENTIASRNNTEESIQNITKLFETPLVNRANKTIVAQSSFFTAKSGAHVFGAGTMQWSWGLDDYGVQQGLRTSRLSTIIERMTWNMIHASGIKTGHTKSIIETDVLTANDGEQSNPPRASPNMGAWMYEPKNVIFFWEKMGDRPFQADFYSKLGKFNRILDIGVRGYNRFCKDMINSTMTQYFQIDPFPPKPEELNNDGILECYVQDVREKFPHLRKSFDLIIDFGVFGWEPVLKSLGDSGVREYIKSILFLMNDNACWALKIDRNGWCDSYNMTQQEFFDEYILPHFHMGDFDLYKSGHNVKRGNFLFYWFYKNNHV